MIGRTLLDPLLPQTKRQCRDTANVEALGGIRNPHLAVERLPGWAVLGRGLESVIEECVQAHWDELHATLKTVGLPEGVPPSPSLVLKLREKIRSTLDLPSEEGERKGLRRHLRAVGH